MKLNNPFSSTNFAVVVMSVWAVMLTVFTMFYFMPVFTAVTLFIAMWARVIYYVIKGK